METTVEPITKHQFITFLHHLFYKIYMKSSLNIMKSLQTIADSAHIPMAIAIRDMLKQDCRCNFLMFANWRDRKKKKNKGTSMYWLLDFGVHNS